MIWWIYINQVGHYNLDDLNICLMIKIKIKLQH